LVETNQDCDGDGYSDDIDIDIDGDRLIEIKTPAEMTAIRYQLARNGKPFSSNQLGCGTDNTTSCIGYELINDISLAAYGSGGDQLGWLPIGHDTNPITEECEGVAFNATFEGNGNTIRDLSIVQPQRNCVGLFGHLGNETEIRHLTVIANEIAGHKKVGVLAGEGNDVEIRDVSIIANSVRGAESIGGMIGSGRRTTIERSAVTLGSIVGNDVFVGGLMGYGSRANVLHSSVQAGLVKSNRQSTSPDYSGFTGYVGGLIGYGGVGRIVASSALIGAISSSSRVGGLAGDIGWGRIVASVALVGSVKGSGAEIGGLAGDATASVVLSSAAITGSAEGGDSIGGLVGGSSIAAISSSMALTDSFTGQGKMGGLIGQRSPNGVTIIDSYSDGSISGMSGGNNDYAETTNSLQSPSGYSSIYSSWDDEADIDRHQGLSSVGRAGVGSNNILPVGALVRWCDTNGNGEIEVAEQTDANQVWDFGSSVQYPTVRCAPINPAMQRQLYRVDSTANRLAFVFDLVTNMKVSKMEPIDCGDELSSSCLLDKNGFAISNIYPQGDVDFYRIQLTSNSQLIVQSEGISNTTLYSSNGEQLNPANKKIIQGNNEGSPQRISVCHIIRSSGDESGGSGDGGNPGRNTKTALSIDQGVPCLVYDLSPGSYYIKAEGYNTNTIGSYSLQTLQTRVDRSTPVATSTPLLPAVQLTLAPTQDPTAGILVDVQNAPAFDSQNIVALRISATRDDGRNITMDDMPIANLNRTYLMELDSGTVWKFALTALYDDGTQLPLNANFIWYQNAADNSGIGIFIGPNHDGDGRADTEDVDIDNDGRENSLDDCPYGDLNWRSNQTSDYDSDGCRDAGEDMDDDNDGFDDQLESPSCVLNPNCYRVNKLAELIMIGCQANQMGMDCDGDGVMNQMDVDADGNGLIEIGTAEQLNGIRYSLNGSGRRLNQEGVLNQNGCGNGNDVLECFGYELIEDINLTDYTAAEGWQPLGQGCSGEAFSGYFHGRGHTISNLTIDRRPHSCIGLFGTIDGGEIYDLHIHATSIQGYRKIGVLAGQVKNAVVDSTSASADLVQGSLVRDSAEAVGGLIGVAGYATIINSSATSEDIQGEGDDLGGLVGRGVNIIVHDSHAAAQTIYSRRGDNVGGLIGAFHQSGVVARSFAITGSMTGRANVGGLIGGTFDYQNNILKTVISSYAVSNSVAGSRDNVGGLIGNAFNAQVIASYAISSSVYMRLNHFAGGLIGKGTRPVIASYAIASQVYADYTSGGLIGRHFASGDDVGNHVFAAYAVSGQVQRRYGAGGGLVGGNTASFGGRENTVAASYWDSNTSGFTHNRYGGSPQETSALQTPTDYSGIYAEWQHGTHLPLGSTVDNITIWCDEDLSGEIESAERRDGNRIWDFGTSQDYPAIRCTSDTVDQQRAWWFLNNSNPQLNMSLFNQELNARLDR